MKAKGKKIETKMEGWVDLGVCLVLIPCLVSVFPVNEWILWRASDVIAEACSRPRRLRAKRGVSHPGED